MSYNFKVAFGMLNDKILLYEIICIFLFNEESTIILKAFETTIVDVRVQ